MGISSWQFLFGHPKNERYERYFRDDNPDLDRHFLAKLDALPPPPTRGGWAPLALRAKMFASIEARAESLSFLKEFAAISLNKKPEPARGDWPINLKAAAHAMLAGSQRLARSLSVNQARRASRQSWAERAAHLTKAAFKDWLAADDSDLVWQVFVQRHAKAQIDYLEDKLAYRLDLCEAHTTAGVSSDTDTAAADRAAWLSALDAGLERDQATLERLRLAMQNADQRADQERGMLSILSGVKPDALDDMTPDKVREELVTTVWVDLPRRLRDTKGMLLETEMQAARIRAETAHAEPGAGGP